MKRQLLSLLAFLVVLTGTAQTIGEAFYVYRSDGMINTFFRSEVDSMSYSYYDVDSTYYDEVVTQVIYTPDSIYRIPLALVDSVGFVTPETKYQPGVVKLEGTIRDYIIGSDSLTVFFRSDTPSDILPKVGDKLVTTEMSDVFIAGFLGLVEEKENKEDTIAVHCSTIGIEDVFECFYYSTGGKPQSNPNKAGTIGWNWNNYYAPGPFAFSLTGFLEANFTPIDCPYKVTPKLDVSIAPTFQSKGSIIVHPFRGVVISMDIKQHTSFIVDKAVSGEINKKHDFAPELIPMYPILPWVFIYGEAGFFLKANAKVALEQHYNQSLGYNIHYEASFFPFAPMPILTSIPKFKISNVNLTTEHDEKLMVDGYVAGGLYGEIGIVPLLSKRIMNAGFRFEGGLKFGGDVILYNSDSEGSLYSTSTYERLKAGTLYLKPFCRVGMKAELIEVGKGEISLFEKEWELGRFKLVPDFSDTKLRRDEEDPSILWATTTPSGSTIVPSTLGFKLYEGEKEEGISGTRFYNYWNILGYPIPYSNMFDSQSPAKDYTVYPTVSLFGKEMLATPSAELEAELRPITFGISNVTDTSATGLGQINRYELMDETMSYGLAYREPGSTTTTICPASSINDIGIFMEDFENLKPSTTYEYFAYLECGDKRYEGTKEMFTTEGKREPYYVWDDVNKTATYYYDGKCVSRGGRIIKEEHRVSEDVSYSILSVVFDSSFSNFYPKSFSFNWCQNLQRIDNLRYLNTDSITDMRSMFNNCNSLTSLDMSNFNTSKVTSFGCTIGYGGLASEIGMFRGCSSLTSLDLSSFNTSNVTSMKYMFKNCTSLANLNLSSFDTSNVTDMQYMFNGCNSLTSLDLSNFNTLKLTGLQYMFCDCTSLTILNLSSFSLNNPSIDCMFSNCHSLKTIYAQNWHCNYMTDHPPFSGCTNLTGGMGSKIGYNLYDYDKSGNPLYYECNPCNSGLARPDGGKDSPGLFTEK